MAADVCQPSLTLRQWLTEGRFDCALNPNFLGALAQLGCLGALQREGLLQNLCGLAGASAGAMSGAAIASGAMVFDGSSEALNLHSDMDDLVTIGERRWKVLDPGWGLGILKGNGVEAEMRRMYKPTFEQLLVPFVCTATSLPSLKTVVLKDGSVPGAVRASMTVPLLFQPGKHGSKRFLVDGGVWDWSGSIGLREMLAPPERSLHIVVNRRMSPFTSHFERIVPPSKFGATRSSIVTLRLNNPPALLFGDASFKAFGQAIVMTGEAVLSILDCPMLQGHEDGHFILEVDVGWNSKPRCSQASTSASYSAFASSSAPPDAHMENAATTRSKSARKQPGARNDEPPEKKLKT